jgi:hypothetical protein
MKKQTLLILLMILIGLANCKEERQIQKQPEKNIIARIQYIKGEAILQKENTQKSAQINDVLEMNDIILTKDDATVDIIVKNKGIIRIGENARVELKTLSEENIELKQDSGTVITHLKKLNANENYSVVTPTSVAAVRGTSFITKVDKDQNTTVALVHGSIEIRDKKGNSMVLDKAGEITIQKQMDLTKQKIRPLSKESLEMLKQLAAQDKGNVQEFVSFVQELKNSSSYKDIGLESNYEEKLEETVSKQEKKIVQKIQSGEETVLKRNIKKDPLKVPPSKDFTKE